MIDHDELRRKALACAELWRAEGAEWEVANAVPVLLDELARLRAAVELEVSICQACSGTGRLPRREYDAASGDHEIVGWGSCLDCADLRAALGGER